MVEVDGEVVSELVFEPSRLLRQSRYCPAMITPARAAAR